MSGVSAPQVWFEGRRLGHALVAPRGCVLSKLTMILACFYPFGPLDLIPNRLPYIGHLDDLLIFATGLFLANRLIPPEKVQDEAGARRDDARPAGAPGLLRRAAWSLRAEILNALALATCRPLLRLVLDRWPSACECRLFRNGMINSVAPVAPLLRGLACVPATRDALTRTMLLSWLLADESYRGPMREGLGSEAPPGDHLRVWTGAPVGFLHVEKTAGTAMVAWLSAHFHPVQIDPDPFRAMPPHVLSPFAPDPQHRFRTRALVHGHYDLPALRRLGPERTVVLMLREPRARLLSMYYYWRSIDPRTMGSGEDSRNVSLAQACGLHEFLTLEDPFIVNYVDNLYVRRLTGAYAGLGAADPLASRPDETLGAALAALAGVGAVGVTELMDESLAAIARVLGVCAGTLPVVNDAQGNRRNRPDEFRAVERELITPAIDERLDRLTRLDRVIYEAARRRLAPAAMECRMHRARQDGGGRGRG